MSERIAPVLVTGATGYVGRRLVPRLLAAGHPVRALVRDPARASLPDGVEAVRGDLTDAASLDAACAGVRAVVNLAAITANVKPPAGGYDRVNADGTAALAAAAARAGASRFVQQAGIDTSRGQPGPYLRGRRRGEEGVRASGVPWVVARPGIMFGGEDAAFVAAMAGLVRRAPAVPVPGDGKLVLQPVWVDDVCSGLLRLLTADDVLGRDHPLGGADRLTYDELLDVVGEALGKTSVRKVHVPLAAMRIQARALQLLPHPPLTPAALELFASDNVAEPNALPALGIEPRGFREHLREHGVS
jgi:NADH dehydrogenase